MIEQRGGDAMIPNLVDKSVLVIGTGGLGGPAALVLASAGVGRLVLIDGDVVETSNLNRQPIFGEGDVGQRKAPTAARRISALFPTVKIDAVDGRFDAGSAGDLTRDVDVIVDGSDNFETRFLANDVAVSAGKPLVHGGILRFTAQLLTIHPGTTGCLRCLFEGPPEPGSIPTCAEAGVLGALAGFAGSLMGAEAARILSGEPGSFAGRLLVYEARTARSRTVPVRRREGCSACGALPLEAAAQGSAP